MCSRKNSGQNRRIARRALLCSIASLALAWLPASPATASCAAVSGSTVRFIVPNSPGGGYDADARLLQPFLEKELRATLVIENRPDAGGLIGAAAIRDAASDGRTMGIINASGLLAVGLDEDAPNPSTDFTILSRLLSNRTVLVTGRDSGIRSLDDLLRVAAKRPIVIGVRDAGSASVFVVPVVASLLGVDYALVTGYVGSSTRVLAAIRGEVDLLVQNLDSLQQFIAGGELRPLLQVTSEPAAKAAGADPNADLLAGVPKLGGAGGVAQKRASSTGRTRERALREARALDALTAAGRVIVAPAGLPDAERRCLEAAVAGVLGKPAFRAAAARARLSIEPTAAATARTDIQRAEAALAELAPIIRSGLRKARQ